MNEKRSNQFKLLWHAHYRNNFVFTAIVENKKNNYRMKTPFEDLGKNDLKNGSE